MDHQASGDDSKLNKDRAYLEQFLKAIKEFDVTKLSGSWSPEEGSEVINALNGVAEALKEKAAEIKVHVRRLTVEELNELDGFDRCNVAQAPQHARPRP